MNKNIFEGKWEQMKGTVQKEWGKLTDDDFDMIQGDAKKLAGRLQERYGYDQEVAEKHINDFIKRNHFE
jgi:uncharacterized protein YjbJ (UPF0337 family)